MVECLLLKNTGFVFICVKLKLWSDEVAVRNGGNLVFCWININGAQDIVKKATLPNKVKIPDTA